MSRAFPRDETIERGVGQTVLRIVATGAIVAFVWMMLEVHQQMRRDQAEHAQFMAACRALPSGSDARCAFLWRHGYSVEITETIP